MKVSRRAYWKMKAALAWMTSGEFAAETILLEAGKKGVDIWKFDYTKLAKEVVETQEPCSSEEYSPIIGG